MEKKERERDEVVEIAMKKLKSLLVDMVGNNEVKNSFDDAITQ